jgi:uncharacterized protein YbaR (Trm112 family)/SAM-dependent methyltransferase
MKMRLLDLLVCPIGKTRLELVEWETSSVYLSPKEANRLERMGLDPDLFSKEIITGVLLNRAKKIFYPIHHGIPRMLVFSTGLGRQFAKRHADRIASELRGFAMPQEIATPGEEIVLRTFSTEWVKYDWDGQSYWSVRPDTIYESMNFLLDLNRRPVKDKLALEIGIGIGGIANHIAHRGECELVGIDLSYAVDSAYKHFGTNTFLHLVQASAFVPPFRENAFDFVYSCGVLHHTFSTRTAFDRICRLPKIGGRLYIWVYSPYGERHTLIRRLIMLIETGLRPFASRLPENLQTAVLLPIIPLYFLHQNLYVTRLGPGYVKYGWREAMHAARDRFTPRYAHRHTEDEVCDWFREAGYGELQRGSERDYPDYVPTSLILATAVDGIRH